MKKLKSVLAFLLSVLTVFGCLAPAFALSPDSERIYDGIDVSVYQGEIDFEAVRRSGVGIVYIRAGYGIGYEDKFFRRNAEEAKNYGLRFGFYFYVTARTPHEAALQGRYFASLIRNTQYDCRPVMDFEEYSGLSHTAIKNIGLAFLRAVEDNTRHLPMLYTDAYAASLVWGADFSRYPLWVADYGPNEPDVTGDTWKRWAGFQYTDAGRVNGIGSTVDLDRFTKEVFLTEDEKAEQCR